MAGAAQVIVDVEKAIALIDKHEGFRAEWYYDTRGFVTIGYGTNLDAAGARDHCRAVGLDWSALRAGQLITEDQARQLMREAAYHAVHVALLVVVGLDGMPENVQLVVIDMIYNLGSTGFLEFHNMIAALGRRDWKAAAAAMKASAWYEQVKMRADDDIALMLAA